MFAVIKTGGKQYRVAADDTLKIEKIAGDVGQIVEIGEVLMVGGDSVTVGNPIVAGATVAAEIVGAERGDKVISFKKRRRKNSRRKRGHRQEYTVIRITEILTDGKKPSMEAKPKPVRKPKAKKDEAAEQPAA
jgi:large subunit ribosomal protein L21